MRITRFFKLRHAITNLDVHFLARTMAQLEERLTKEGQPWESENTAVTEEGIFYINPETGMATRVALYVADHSVRLPSVPRRRRQQTEVHEIDNITDFHPYHLLRCNALTKAEREGVTPGYRVAQRMDGKFFYRFVRELDEPTRSEEMLRVVPDLKLDICPNCFFKVTSLLEGIKDLKQDTFSISYFFNVDFFRSWCRYGEYSKSGNSLANMYPKDWDEICRIRREQVQYHCEACSADLSAPDQRKLLHVHPTDHYKKKVSFVKLQCLCPECANVQLTPSRSVEQPRA